MDCKFIYRYRLPSPRSQSYLQGASMFHKHILFCYRYRHPSLQEVGNICLGISVSQTHLVLLQVQASLPPEVPDQQQIEQTTSAIPQQPELGSMTEADSYFTKAAQQPPQQAMESEPTQEPNQPYTRQRPFQEIVSKVQGNFNFLQESTIDMECK